MPKLSYRIRTPLGEFGSLLRAARAHHTTPDTIQTRCQEDPANYERIDTPKPAAKQSWTQTAKTTWPLTWYQYKGLSWEAKEEIWANWCQATGRDPEAESTVTEFYAIMDSTQDTAADN